MIKYLSIILLILVAIFSIGIAGFIWFNWLIVVRYLGTFAWFIICCILSIGYFSRGENIEDV